MTSLSRFISCALILVTSILFPSPGQSQETKARESGSISGRVTIRGKPASGISVAAIAGDTINRRDAAVRSSTDGEGYYHLTGLMPGPYQIWTLTPGMVADSGALSGYFGSSKTILLSAGEEVANVDLKLMRGGVITGRVTDTTNKPVIEERISLQMLAADGSSRFGLPVMHSDQINRTDDRGVYRIYGLPPGRYKVSVGSDPRDGLARGRSYERTFYPDTKDESKATVVELKEGDEVDNIDMKLGRAGETFYVSGRVIDAETGLPIARAGVRFMLVRQDKAPPSPSMGIQADDRGEFIFEGFGPGRYTAVANSEAYGGNFYGDSVPFDVIDKDVTGLELKAVPGLSLSGLVVADGLMIKDLLALLPGLRVFVRSESSVKAHASGGGNAAIESDGSFRINGLRPGRMTIGVYTWGRNLTRPTIARIERDGLSVNQGFEILESTSGILVALNHGSGVIRGTVKFEGGEGSLSDSRGYVICKREGARDGTDTQVDSRGHFILKNLAPGTYEVAVQISGTRPHRPPPKQLINVTNGSESEVVFVIDLTPRQGGP